VPAVAVDRLDRDVVVEVDQTGQPPTPAHPRTQLDRTVVQHGLDPRLRAFPLPGIGIPWRGHRQVEPQTAEVPRPAVRQVAEPAEHTPLREQRHGPRVQRGRPGAGDRRGPLLQHRDPEPLGTQVTGEQQPDRPSAGDQDVRVQC
jgi:hypothetical protein